MRFKVFKNTVLLFVLVVVSCAGKVGSEKLEVRSETDSSNVLRQAQHDTLIGMNEIIIGSNRTEVYLPLLKGKRVGVVANQTSVIFKEIATSRKKNETRNDSSFVHLVDSLLYLNINIKKVFSPEHGFRGTADAGENVKDGVDTKTGLPIFSLHGKHKKPTAEQLEDLDIIIFDIQDVGVRFYTYISTLHYVMEACAENNVPLLILDRPNPNGNYVDGPVLEKEHSSFLGMHPIPLVHGMTIGEYAQMINGEGWLEDNAKCEITVVEMENYNHDSFHSLPIRPSPNLPNDQSIMLYPSLGLFEGTNINAGRGTEFQFQRYGAPFLDSSYYEFSYTPQPNFGSKYPKHKGEVCYGADLSNVKPERKFTLKYVMDAYNHATDKSKVFNTANFTKHAGTAKLQQQIEAGLSEAEIRATWKKGLVDFKKTRAKYLIYD
ncbi:exo-beta-N-acetylmuramidase NamZ domain-containing protein [Winogradskyella sp.]|uniref:exo-beta-N-acetylmuramidase NamZ family protein n=1 Tax=Winogradskyella sp. TaxID=1883156 RepID=UPI003517ACB5